jgi:hypothetical protein
MENKRPVGIILTGITLFLFPFIAFLIINALAFLIIKTRLLWSFQELIKTEWYVFIFYAILGLGIFKLNNKVRLFVITWMTSIGAGLPLGLVFAVFVMRLDIQKILGFPRGASVLMFPWLVISFSSLICFSIANYLSRPRVKEQFK